MITETLRVSWRCCVNWVITPTSLTCWEPASIEVCIRHYSEFKLCSIPVVWIMKWRITSEQMKTNHSWTLHLSQVICTWLSSLLLTATCWISWGKVACWKQTRPLLSLTAQPPHCPLSSSYTSLLTWLEAWTTWARNRSVIQQSSQ